jgi:hypothetical protein
MILNQKQTKCETNMQGATAFTIQANAKMFRILSNSLYSNKERAIIREVSCNAFDANVDAGNGDEPIEVNLPNDLEAFFSIKDKGTGLSPEQMVNIYTQYGNSTKTDRNDQIGALGLGSKSPFSYIDSFTVISIKDGLRSTYSCYIDGSGEPKLQPFGSEETDEHNGVEVRFPVKSEDFVKFKQEAEIVFRPFKVKPTVTGNADYKVKDFDILLESDTENDWELVKPISHSWKRDQIRVAVQGNIEYPINIDKISEFLSENAKTFLYEDFRLYFNIGDLDIAASREELGYDKITIENIVTKFEKMASEIIEAQNKKINSYETKYEAMKYIADIQATSRIYRDFTFEYKGEPIITSVKFDSNKFQVVKYASKGRNIRREALNNRWNSEFTFNVNSAKTEVIFVLADENKTKSVTKARSLVNNDNVVYLVNDKDFFNIIGDPEYIKASDIKLEVTKKTKVRGKHFKKYYNDADLSRQYRNTYTTAVDLDVDLGETFYYTEIKNNLPTNGKNIYSYYRVAEKLGLLDDITVIGISAAYTKTKAFKEFEANGIEIYDYLEELLKNSKELKSKIQEINEFRNFDIYNNLPRGFSNVLESEKILSEFSEDHIINKVANITKKEYGYWERDELRFYGNTMINLGILDEEESFERLDIELVESYPLLNDLEWSFPENAVLEYIKGQDLLKKLKLDKSSANNTETENQGENA